MKIYDKKIYNSEQKLNNVVIIILVFLLGFFTGFILKEKQTNEVQVNNAVVLEENITQNSTQNTI